MIDYFSGVDTEFLAGAGTLYCFAKKGQVKSPILHNTKDGSNFYVPYFSHCL